MNSNPHAVIIDDNENNLTVMKSLLSLKDFTCTTIQNPTRLDAVLQGVEKIDIVFVDLAMPGLNGYEVLKILREEMGITVPIVAYTAYVNEIEIAREQGFDSFLSKPLRIDIFPDQVQRILNGESIWEVD